MVPVLLPTNVGVVMHSSHEDMARSAQVSQGMHWMCARGILLYYLFSNSYGMTFDQCTLYVELLCINNTDHGQVFWKHSKCPHDKIHTMIVDIAAT